MYDFPFHDAKIQLFFEFLILNSYFISIFAGENETSKHRNMTNTDDCKPHTDLTADEQFMRKALQEAQQAFDEGEIPIGAVVVCQGRIIARAHNLTETLHDVTAHAEMQAVTAAANELGGKYLTDCTLYVTVEPCTMCAGALGWSQIPRIVYGCPDEKRGYTLYAPRALHPKCTVTGGVLEQECRQLMQDFFRSRR
jgi:tRNA(adenine34) deaminase